MSEPRNRFDVKTGNIENSQVAVGNKINQNYNSPPSTDSTPPKIDDLLTDLKKAIEEEFASNEKGKEKALKQLEILVKAAEQPDEQKKDDADNASVMLKGLSAGAAILTIIEKVRVFFGL
jgi:hypothetical protein